MRQSRRARMGSRGLLGALLAGVLSMAALGYVSPAAAQYAFNPRAADELGPGVRYFGSAKDEQGAFLSGVTVVLRAKSFTFVFFTDELGRFHGKLPVGTTPELVTATCSKGDFELVRASKRATPAVATQGVQVDCLLRAARAK